MTRPQTDEGAPAPGPAPQAAAVSPAAPSSLPRRFQLIRHLDVSGVSGTGVVADGVQFDDGAVALRWKGDYPSTAVWDSIASILAVHGHAGATDLEWIDDVVVACRVCGCTDEAACFGTCFWVETDLCSACVKAPEQVV